MRAICREMLDVIRRVKGHSVGIQRKLVLYWFCMAMAAFVAALFIFSIMGIVPGYDRHLGEALTVQEQNAVTSLSRQLDTLTARGITLSREITRGLDGILLENGKTFDDLNDNPALISDVEGTLYSALETTLRSNSCSGAFFLLDATVNTQSETAETSRMGVYLRFSDLKAVGTADQHIVYFRGAADVARKEQVQMHNRWDLEFDTEMIPGYDTLMDFSGKRLAEGCQWSERMRLRDTWEDVLLLCVPVMDNSGKVRGICGVELSGLYFTLTYPAADSSFGNIVTVLAPMDGNTILMEKAMIGNPGGTYLTAAGAMNVDKGRYYMTCTDGTCVYMGTSQMIDARSAGGFPLAVITMISESSYRQHSSVTRKMWILGSFGFLVLLLLLSLCLSKQFASPILQSLRAIQGEEALGEHHSGISEIDALVSFIHSKNLQKPMLGELPPDIEELLQEFSARVQTLTPTERVILQLFIEGCDIHEAAARAFISVGTARKHNTNINKKLCVSTREELMLYIDLFRRCDRLEELIYQN